jgi:hypothetical protein
LLVAAMLRRSISIAAAATGIAAAAGLVDAARRTSAPTPGLAPAAAADSLAYGAGVWWGALRARTTVPLLPRRDGTDNVSG